MKISIAKAVIVSGLCAVLAGAGTTAFAQGNDDQNRPHGQYQHDQNGQGWYQHGQSQYHQGRGQYQHGQYHQGQDGQSQYYQGQRGQYRHGQYDHAMSNGDYNASRRVHPHGQSDQGQYRRNSSQDHHDSNQNGR